MLEVRQYQSGDMDSIEPLVDHPPKTGEFLEVAFGHTFVEDGVPIAAFWFLPHNGKAIVGVVSSERMQKHKLAFVKNIKAAMAVYGGYYKVEEYYIIVDEGMDGLARLIGFTPDEEQPKFYKCVIPLVKESDNGRS